MRDGRADPKVESVENFWSTASHQRLSSACREGEKAPWVSHLDLLKKNKIKQIRKKKIPRNPQNTKPLLNFVSLHLVLSQTAISFLGLLGCCFSKSFKEGLEASLSWKQTSRPREPSHSWLQAALGKRKDLPTPNFIFYAWKIHLAQHRQIFQEQAISQNTVKWLLLQLSLVFRCLPRLSPGIPGRFHAGSSLERVVIVCHML